MKTLRRLLCITKLKTSRASVECPAWRQRNRGWIFGLLGFMPLLGIINAAAREPFLSIVSGALPVYVLRGKLFTERFDIIHAGSAMDQPTIGKWLIVFAALSVVAIPAILLMRWLNERNTRLKYWSFAVPVSIVGIMLPSILTWPFCMLIQYVTSMGFTVKRSCGLALCLTAFAALPLFCRWTVRSPGKIKSDNWRI